VQSPSNTCMHACLHAYILSMHACIYTYMHAYIHMYICTYVDEKGVVSQWLAKREIGDAVAFKHIKFNIKSQYPFHGATTHAITLSLSHTNSHTHTHTDISTVRALLLSRRVTCMCMCVRVLSCVSFPHGVYVCEHTALSVSHPYRYARALLQTD